MPAITIDETHVTQVCRRGQREKTCTFLIVGDGYKCAKEDERLVKTIKIERDNWVAKGDNCSGPPDFTPTSASSKVAPVPDGHVRCKVCDRVFVPSFFDEYYNGTTNTDGVCEKCLLT